jgi:hypothetical protein
LLGACEGDRKGPQEVFEFFRWLAKESGGTLRVELHDVLANDEYGVSLVEVTTERKGHTLQQKATHTFNINESRVTEFWAFLEDPARATISGLSGPL